MSASLTITGTPSDTAFLAQLIRRAAKDNPKNEALAELVADSKNNNLALVESVGNYALREVCKPIYLNTTDPAASTQGNHEFWCIILDRIVS